MTCRASGDVRDEVFGRLKRILEPYGQRLQIVDGAPWGYSVDMAPPEERNPTTWFGGVRRGRAYVSYYLMPGYVEPSLLEDVSPELRKGMQGKSCFSFRVVDDARLAELAELAELTRRRYERTAGDRRWGVAKRMERGMAHREAMDALR